VTGGLDISPNGQVYANLAEQVALEVAERFTVDLLGPSSRHGRANDAINGDYGE
jgi:hypothetical protein